MGRADDHEQGGGEKASPERRINLRKAEILVVDASPRGLDILSQILEGFGALKVSRTNNAPQAQAMLETKPYDLVFIDPLLRDMDGYELVRWLRRLPSGDNRYVPVIVISAHTQISKVREARDCGANFIVAKPLSPPLLFERILWVAREQRVFVDSGVFVGPDRRFKVEDPPDGVRRRHDDPKAQALPDAAIAADPEPTPNADERGGLQKVTV